MTVIAAVFRDFDGHYVVMRKVTDEVNSVSYIVPEIKEYWAVCQIYQKVFDHCPTPEELEDVPFAPVCTSPQAPSMDGTFICESSMRYFKQRNCVVIGRNLENILQQYNKYAYLFMGINTPWGSTDGDILHAIL